MSRLAAIVTRLPRGLATGLVLPAALILTVIAPDLSAAWTGLVALTLALILPLALAAEPAIRASGRALLGLATIALLLFLFGVVGLQLARPANDVSNDVSLAWLAAICLFLGGSSLGVLAHVAGRSPATPGGDLAACAVQLALLASAQRLPAGAPMFFSGLVLLLAGAIAAVRATAPVAWIAATAAAHAGLVLLAAPAGAPRVAILLHIGLLTLTRAALVRGAFAIGLLALAAVPPSGLFASSYLILTGLPVPLAVLATAALLLPLVRLPRLLPLPAAPVSPPAAIASWVLLALATFLGIAMPPPFAARLAAFAVATQ